MLYRTAFATPQREIRPNSTDQAASAAAVSREARNAAAGGRSSCTHMQRLRERRFRAALARLVSAAEIIYLSDLCRRAPRRPFSRKTHVGHQSRPAQPLIRFVDGAIFSLVLCFCCGVIFRPALLCATGTGHWLRLRRAQAKSKWPVCHLRNEKRSGAAFCGNMRLGRFVMLKEAADIFHGDRQ